MIYLKNLNGQIKEMKDRDARTIDSMVDSGRWVRVQGLKDTTPYAEPKKWYKTKKKKSTKK